MKIIRILGLGIVGIIVILALVISFTSPISRVERSVVIHADSQTIFSMLNSYKQFILWSPWETIDPDTKSRFEGPDEGVGAKIFWDSDNKDVGKGEQWIIESEPNRYIKNGLKFGDFEGTYISEFILTPEDDYTKVTWTYQGDVSNTGLGSIIMGKMFSFFIDDILGETYEKGLNSLKKLTENRTPLSDSMPSSTDNEEVEKKISQETQLETNTN